MLRVNADILAVENGKYFYQGELFTGIAFVVSEGVVKNAKEYKTGELMGNYSNEYLPNEDNQLKIDSDYLEPENEDDYEPFRCYKGERFSGIAYDFEVEGLCTGEWLYIDGWSDSDVTYYKSGVLEAVELIDDDFSQVYYWYEHGQIKKYEIFERDFFDITLAFEETGELTTLGINGDYFERIKNLSNEMKFCLFEEKDFISGLKGTRYLSVSGSSVDDEVFGSLLTNGGLGLTSKLSICRTSLTVVSLKKLLPYTNINQLFVESESICFEDMKSFKSQRPGCYVEFNRVEVMV